MYRIAGRCRPQGLSCPRASAPDVPICSPGPFFARGKLALMPPGPPCGPGAPPPFPLPLCNATTIDFSPRWRPRTHAVHCCPPCQPNFDRNEVSPDPFSDYPEPPAPWRCRHFPCRTRRSCVCVFPRHSPCPSAFPPLLAPMRALPLFLRAHQAARLSRCGPLFHPQRIART